MALEVVPRSVIVLPDDRQPFTAQGGAGPALWYSPSNCTIQPDLSLLVTSSPGQASCALDLVGGAGIIDWVIDANCLPVAGGGKFRVECSFNAGARKYTVELTNTDITVFNESFSLIILTDNPQVGDRFRIVLDASRHFYLNGVLRHETFLPFSEPTQFPAFFFGKLTTPVSGATPRIPPLALTGNWQLNGGANTWTTPAEGQLTDLSGAKTTFFNGESPGAYQVRAQVGGSVNQQFDAVITIPPLTVIGSNAVTLDPGQVVRLRTNYDLAQNDIIAWSVVTGGGGSFDAADNYTAPVAPGNYTIRATHSTLQQVDIIVTVRSVLTPNYIAVMPSETVDWETNLSSPTWTASAGSINSGTGVWTAPSVIGQTVRITATSGGSSVSRDVVVLEKFPFDDPALPLTWDRRKTVLISRAEDRTRGARVKDKGNLPFETFELAFKNRTVTQLQTAHDFWDRYYPDKKFIFDDKLRNVRKVVYFDSDVRQEGNARCGIDFSFRLIEA